MPEAIPRPPWMWNTPYLQDLYRSNQAYYDERWNSFVAANPQYANFGRQTNPNLLPSGGSPSFTPPSQQNWPGGNMPTFDLDPTLGGFTNPYNPGAGPSGMDFSSNSNPSSGGSWWNTPWGQMLIQTGLGLATNKLLGGKTSEERALSKFATAPYESSESQRFLPPALRSLFTDRPMLAGIANIGSLMERPGGLSPSVSEAINPRLAAESQNIAQQYRGIASNQAGAAARGNLPVSLKAALQSALDVAQERAQRGARGAALAESESLRREDVGQTYKMLDAILQFISSGRGQAIPGLQSAANMSGQRQAMNMAGVSNLLNSISQPRY